VKERFGENHLRTCDRMFLAFTNKLHNKQGGMCYTTKCDMVQDGLTERASEGTPRGGGKEANPTILCNLGNVGRNG
jgi:hypothetical protein